MELPDEMLIGESANDHDRSTHNLEELILEIDANNGSSQEQESLAEDMDQVDLQLNIEGNKL